MTPASMRRYVSALRFQCQTMRSITRKIASATSIAEGAATASTGGRSGSDEIDAPAQPMTGPATSAIAVQTTFTSPNTYPREAPSR